MQKGNHELRNVATLEAVNSPELQPTRKGISVLQPQGTELWNEQEMDPPPSTSGKEHSLANTLTLTL